MRKPLLALWVAVLWPAVLVSDLPAAEIPGRNPLNRKYMVYPGPAVLPLEVQTFAGPVPLSAASSDTTLLAWFTFDSATGLPDPQGWTGVDLNAELDLFFHVAGLTELDGGDFGRLVPLEGSQSMWCGVDLPIGDPFCNWAGLPGYGSN